MWQSPLGESEDVAMARRQIGFINIIRRRFGQPAAVVREMVKAKDGAVAPTQKHRRPNGAPVCEIARETLEVVLLCS